MPIYTTLDFLRHGEPMGGKRYRGKTDDPLSQKGWAQMCTATAGERPWMAIVSSPLSRCRTFAEWLAGVTGLPLSVDERLAEVGIKLARRIVGNIQQRNILRAGRRDRRQD